MNKIRNPMDVVGQDVKPHLVITHMVEVKLLGDNDTMYRRVLETLTRIGVIPKGNEETLIQNCHILHKQGKYYIVHYKMMYLLDGGENRVTVHDIIRQSKIIRLLAEWGMVEVVNPDQISLPAHKTNLGDLKIIPFEDRNQWNLQTKYVMGQVLKHTEDVYA